MINDISAVTTAPPAGAIAALRGWTVRRWLTALLPAVATVLVIGIPTVLVPNSVFGRAVPVTWWAWPVLVVTAIMAGLLTATYVRAPQEERRIGLGMAGGLLSYFAVGCPVCNKLALLALGYTGALRWFAPAQPVLAVAGIALLSHALRRRLVGELACLVPTAASRQT